MLIVFYVDVKFDDSLFLYLDVYKTSFYFSLAFILCKLNCFFNGIIKQELFLFIVFFMVNKTCLVKSSFWISKNKPNVFFAPNACPCYIEPFMALLVLKTHFFIISYHWLIIFQI